MIIIIGIAILVSIVFNFQAIKICIEADAPEGAWKELFKMFVSIIILVYLSKGG